MKYWFVNKNPNFNKYPLTVINKYFILIIGEFPDTAIPFGFDEKK